MAIISIGLGWLVAGRALRPVRTMSVRARGISERNLHERLALEGPDDELKELGDTFDELLAPARVGVRVPAAVRRQRLARAAHPDHARTGARRGRARRPGADAESLRGTCRRVLAAGEQQERMIEALLTLARSQRGLAVAGGAGLDELAADALRWRPPRRRPRRVRARAGARRRRPRAGRAADRRTCSRTRSATTSPRGGWVRCLDGDRDGAPDAAGRQQRPGRHRRGGRRRLPSRSAA